MDNTIHTTIGVYANGSMKMNGVSEINLANHIQYNIDYRPGRALFVDGICKNQGYLSIEQCDEYSRLFGGNAKYQLHQDTAPYH